MNTKHPALILLFISLGWLVADGSTALAQPRPEPWADQRLQVTQGLFYWYEAARAGGDKAIGADKRIERWADASGHGHHLIQPKPEARPERMSVGNTAIARFDGVDDFFRLVLPTATRDRLTVFVAAAPRRNLGGFPGVFTLNAAGQRDYLSGLTLDLGPAPGSKFSTLNVEGRGFNGFQNLAGGERPFGTLAVMEFSMTDKAVFMHIDGKIAGERPRRNEPVSIAELTLGARYYNNSGPDQYVQGFGAFDVAEVIVYDRSLNELEQGQVRKYLSGKYKDIRNDLPPDTSGSGLPLEPVKNPPPVQALRPGFSVNELPLDLTNINNLLYRPDGSLIALAYNGVIWRLTDTNGDGLEDKSDVFWDGKGKIKSPLGMDLTPPGYPHGDGVFIVEKTRCMLITDTNADGKADRELEIAAWPDKDHQIGGLGLAFDKRDGSIYYGRGTADFTNAFLKNPAGKAAYSLKAEDGTITRLSPDFKTREIVATGIRFPVGLRFNAGGELFATDQEGATWLPNGNPFDELLFIDKGRHYGFPPRHPEHLPGVIDEPSVFDYGPQHQSTCGFCFNEPVRPGGPTFGPTQWAGDAIVTGESRGKLYRTKVVKTATGHVARNEIFACLNMLTVDCCVAPDGSLRVACHSGGPDWGSGPMGKGKIYRIKYTDQQHPQPVLAWAAGPREVRVEFDRPVDPALLRDVVKKSRLTGGTAVRAGDRFESLWPGYAVVQAQKVAPRFDFAIRSAQLTPDNRTLLLATDPINTAFNYALTLPGMGRPVRDLKNATAQVAEIDLDFDLSGCQARFVPSSGGTEWNGWLPHADLAVAQALTAGSAPHDELWRLLKKPGELTLRTRMDLSRMLRPAVQPGSSIDHTYPLEQVTVKFESSGKLNLKMPAAATNSGTTAFFSTTSEQNKPALVDVELSLAITGGDAVPSLSAQFNTAEDTRPRALPLRRFFVPWSSPENARSSIETKLDLTPELAGGSWARGRSIFYGQPANCAACHTVHGQGGRVGPDLSNLIHRDYASVLRDIAQPSFAINPDHVSSVVELKDGRVLTGVVRTDGESLLIADSKGTETRMARADVERTTPSTTSIMPEGLPVQLGPDRMKDLMSFLLTRGPAMPEYGAETPPPVRSRAEVAAALAGAPNPPEPIRPIKIVLVTSQKDHGPGEHDYPAFSRQWRELLAIAEKTTVETADTWPTPAQLASADVLVFYQQGTWNAERARALDAFLKRGGGAVYLHYAVDGGPDAPGFADRIGLAWEGGKSKFRHGPLELEFNPSVKHPISRNMARLKLHDESYWQLFGKTENVNKIAVGNEEGKVQPLFWSVEKGPGRVVVSIPGHYAWTFDDPLFRLLLLRSIAWSAREPVDRFNDLVYPGARLKD